MPRRTNDALNLIRAAAAVLVVIGHLRQFLFAPYADLAAPGPLVTAGYALGSVQHGAVIVFFVLSGYWVGGSVIAQRRAGRFRAGRYVVARLVRLYVVLVPALALTLVLALVGLAAFPGHWLYAAGGQLDFYPSAFREAMGLDTLFGNLAFLQTVVVEPYANNGPLWSLASEFWFYMLFPVLCAALAAGTRLASRLLALLAVPAALVLLGPTIALGFTWWLLGVAVAMRRDAIAATLRRWSPARRGLVRGGLLVALPIAMVLDGAGSGPGGLYAYGVALAATALIATLVVDPRLPRPLARVSRYADVSFSLYAVHFPIAALLVAAVGPSQLAARWAPTPLHLGQAASMLCVLLITGWAFGQLTERHTDALRRRVLALGHREPLESGLDLAPVRGFPLPGALQAPSTHTESATWLAETSGSPSPSRARSASAGTTRPTSPSATTRTG